MITGKAYGSTISDAVTTCSFSEEGGRGEWGCRL